MNRILIFAVIALSLIGASALAVTQPNVLVIVADDMGYHDVGFQGCKDIPTPNIDRIATEGVRFSNGYVSAAMCSPSRAGLLAGIYQQRFGHENNESLQGANQGMDTRVKTLADHLHSSGYATGWVGKWHLGEAPRYQPQRRGFDDTFCFLWGMRSYFPLKDANAQARDRRLYRNGVVLPEEDGYLTDVFGREACAFIERHAEKPWFLYFAFNAPHTPMDAKDVALARFSHIA